MTFRVNKKWFYRAVVVIVAINTPFVMFVFTVVPSGEWQLLFSPWFGLFLFLLSIFVNGAVVLGLPPDLCAITSFEDDVINYKSLNKIKRMICYDEVVEYGVFHYINYPYADNYIYISRIEISKSQRNHEGISELFEKTKDIIILQYHDEAMEFLKTKVPTVQCYILPYVITEKGKMRQRISKRNALRKKIRLCKVRFYVYKGTIQCLLAISTLSALLSALFFVLSLTYRLETVAGILFGLSTATFLTLLEWRKNIVLFENDTVEYIGRLQIVNVIHYNEVQEYGIFKYKTPLSKNRDFIYISRIAISECQRTNADLSDFYVKTENLIIFQHNDSAMELLKTKMPEVQSHRVLR